MQRINSLFTLTLHAEIEIAGKQVRRVIMLDVTYFFCHRHNVDVFGLMVNGYYIILYQQPLFLPDVLAA